MRETSAHIHMEKRMIRDVVPGHVATRPAALPLSWPAHRRKRSGCGLQSVVMGLAISSPMRR
jgi:hypothetical protein